MGTNCLDVVILAKVIVQGSKNLDRIIATPMLGNVNFQRYGGTKVLCGLYSFVRTKQGARRMDGFQNTRQSILGPPPFCVHNVEHTYYIEGKLT